MSDDPIRDPMLPGFDGTVAVRQEKFNAFHAAHPDVYVELCRRARVMRGVGLRFGLRPLWEAMRWDYALKSATRGYKLNNDLAPFYSRLIMAQEEDLAGVFNTRGAA